jgi:hypothetical protein
MQSTSAFAVIDGVATVRNISGGTVNVSATGRVNVSANGGPVGTSKINGITVTGGGKFDLSNNKLIVISGTLGTASGGTYTGLSALVQTGLAGGTWNGNGVMTSQPAASSGLTAIGIATAGQTGYAGGTFSGQSVAAGDVIMMYTYGGDANLDGQITGDDYSAIDFNILVPGASGWYNGDFNYDGQITGDDYSTIDFNILAQGAPFSTASTGGTIAVPEPSACLVAAGMSIAALLNRRRRCR